MEHFLIIHNAMNNAKIYGEIMVVNLLEIQYPEAVAEIADFLVRLEGIETILAMGHYEGSVILSMRTTNHEVNAGEMIKRLVAGRGTAGGHGMTAGGKLDDIHPANKIRNETEKDLTERLLLEFSLTGTPPRKLIPY